MTLRTRGHSFNLTWLRSLLFSDRCMVLFSFYVEVFVENACIRLIGPTYVVVLFIWLFAVFTVMLLGWSSCLSMWIKLILSYNRISHSLLIHPGVANISLVFFWKCLLYLLLLLFLASCSTYLQFWVQKKLFLNQWHLLFTIFMTSSYTIFAAFLGTISLYYFICQDLVYFNHITSNNNNNNNGFV